MVWLPGQRVVLAVTAVLAVAGLCVAAAPTVLDEFLLDGLVNVFPHRRPDATVVLVDYDVRKTPDPSRVESFAKEVATGGARGLIVVPPKHQKHWPLPALSIPTWQPQRMAWRDRDNRGRLQAQTAGPKAGSSQGLWCAPVTHAGRARSVPRQIRLGGESVDCVQTLVAAALHLPNQNTQEWRYDPTAAIDRMPHLLLSPEGGLGWLESQARDRIVVLAPVGEDRPYPIVDFAQANGVNEGDVQAMVLDSALRRAETRPLSMAWAFLLLPLALAAGFAVGRQLRRWRDLLALGLIAVLVSGLLAWVLLAFGHRLFPLSAWILAGLGGVVLALEMRLDRFGHWLRNTQQILHPIAVEAPPIDNASDSLKGWLVFLHQQLGFSRMLLMRRIVQSWRIEPVAFFHCDASELLEQRRDWRREPWQRAAQSRDPMPAPKPVLAESSDLVQSVIALKYGDELEGFLVFAQDPAIHREVPLPAVQISQYADQLARALHWSREQRQLATPGPVTDGARWLAGDEAAMAEAVGQDVGGVVQRLQALSDIAQTHAQPLLVRDVFDHPVYTNHAFEEYAQATSLPLHAYSGLELLTRMTGIAAEQAHLLLREVVNQGRDIELPVLPECTLKGHLVLRLRAVRAEQSKAQRFDLPFGVLGVLYEWVDASDLAQNRSWIADLLEDLSHRLRNDLEALTQAWMQLEDSGASVPPMIKRIFDRRLRDGQRSIQTIESELVAALKSDQAHTMPLNVAQILQRVVQELDPVLQARQVRIETDIPTFCALGFATEKNLQDMLARTLTFLAQDATPGTRLQVSLREAPDRVPASVRVRLQNEGIGTPDWHLAEAYKTAANEDHAELATEVERLIASNLQTLQRWGGEFEIESGIGKGYTITFGLKAFAHG